MVHSTVLTDGPYGLRSVFCWILKVIAAQYFDLLRVAPAFGRRRQQKQTVIVRQKVDGSPLRLGLIAGPPVLFAPPRYHHRGSLQPGLSPPQ